MNSSDRGFTLIELLIVVVIIGVIAAIGYPSYVDYVRKAHRADAQSVLLDAQIKEERYRAYNNSYGTPTALASDSLGITTSDDYYTYTISGPTSSAYEVLANAIPGKAQYDDTDCRTMTIDQSNNKTPTGCWKK